MPSIVIYFSQNVLNSDSDEILPESSEIWKTSWNSANAPKFGEIQRTLFSNAMLPAKEIFSDELGSQQS